MNDPAGNSSSPASSSRSIASLPAPVIVIRGVAKPKRSLAPWVVGASLAGALTIGLVALRRKGGRHSNNSRKSVVGTVTKSVLFAAAGTIPKILLRRLLKRAFPGDEQRARDAGPNVAAAASSRAGTERVSARR